MNHAQLTYRKVDQNGIELDLQKILQEKEDITLNAILFAKKLLVSCYFALGRKQEALQSFEAFKKAIRNNEEEIYQRLQKSLELLLVDC